MSGLLKSQIRSHVVAMSGLDRKGRRDYLQSLIGRPTEQKRELQVRALLMSELNRAGVWPPRG